MPGKMRCAIATRLARTIVWVRDPPAMLDALLHIETFHVVSLPPALIVIALSIVRQWGVGWLRSIELIERSIRTRLRSVLSGRFLFSFGVLAATR